MDNKYVEQVREAHTPNDMRAELYRVSREDSLVRSVFQMADYNGMSAEDRYTVLAYHAMAARNKLMQESIEFAMVYPHQPIIISKPT